MILGDPFNTIKRDHRLSGFVVHKQTHTNLNILPMSKRSAPNTPLFPDSTGWSPKATSTRHQVVNPSNPNCGEFFWRIQLEGGKLTYFEYEEPNLRARAKKDFWSSRATNKPQEVVGHGNSISSVALVEKIESLMCALGVIQSNQLEMMSWLRAQGFADAFDAEDAQPSSD